MEPVAPAEGVPEEPAEEGSAAASRAELLRAIAEGLADDAAGRTMGTAELKRSLEATFGPIRWP